MLQVDARSRSSLPAGGKSNDECTPPLARTLEKSDGRNGYFR